jgi:hypothetical protein
MSERALFLCRNSNTVGELPRNLSRLSLRCQIVYDHPPLSRDEPNDVWVPDFAARGYQHVMSGSKKFPSVTAWSRAFVHLSQSLEDDEAVWFIEDDVAGDTESFRQLLVRTKEVNADFSTLRIRAASECPNWPWWHTASDFFERPWKSFNPLCRLSARLIRKPPFTPLRSGPRAASEPSRQSKFLAAVILIQIGVGLEVF